MAGGRLWGVTASLAVGALASLIATIVFHLLGPATTVSLVGRLLSPVSVILAVALGVLFFVWESIEFSELGQYVRSRVPDGPPPRPILSAPTRTFWHGDLLTGEVARWRVSYGDRGPGTQAYAFVHGPICPYCGERLTAERRDQFGGLVSKDVLVCDCETHVPGASELSPREVRALADREVGTAVEAGSVEELDDREYVHTRSTSVPPGYTPWRTAE